MAAVPRQRITQRKIAEHVQRLGEHYPPIRLDSVDRTIMNPRLVVQKFGHVIDYLARVELEVDRNVLEILCLLPDVDDINKTFYADVWQPQEIQHGLILDRLQQDLGHQPAQPHLDVSLKIKILGTLATLKPIQDIAKLLYYLTGASTERQAVLAYNRINDGLKQIGETAISETIITPIKQQEPGHFAFYQMSATAMIQDRMLKPWQLFLTRVLREKSYNLVGTNAMKQVQGRHGRRDDRPRHRRGPDRIRPGDRPRREPAALGPSARYGGPALHPQGASGECRSLPGAAGSGALAGLT